MLFRYLRYGVAALMLASCTQNIEDIASDPIAPSSEVKIEASIFERWVEARAGSGDSVHWVSEGSVYAYPSGEKLFGMIGFDSSKVIWPDKENEPVTHLTRKTFTYTDAQTGEILKTYKGRPVKPIAYPYQLITYRRENGLIYGDVEQGVEPNVRQIDAKNGMVVTEFGADTLFVNASVFLDIPIGENNRLEAWENYDFFIHNAGAIDRPYQMSWQRFGDLPAWAGEGKAIYHLASWRVDSTDKFPSHILEWAQAEQPDWLRPPASVEEIRELQSGKAPTGWGQ